MKVCMNDREHQSSKTDIAHVSSRLINRDSGKISANPSTKLRLTTNINFVFWPQYKGCPNMHIMVTLIQFTEHFM